MFVQYDGSYAFVIQLSGHAEIPHMAERARINVSVASAGINKAAVSDEVLTAAKHIESLCRGLSPPDDSAEAKAVAPLAHWSKTGLRSTSHIPDHDSSEDTPPRQYDISIRFDIRFRDFGALGGFSSRLSALPHVEVMGISWLLTRATETSFRSQLRKDAARDALQKARDYCEVLQVGELRPIELTEGVQHGFSGYSVHQTGAGFGSVNTQMQSAAGVRKRAAGAALMPAASTNVGVTDQRVESELAFEPQELNMSMDVTIKFIAK